jgi:hypothetical protein
MKTDLSPARANSGNHSNLTSSEILSSPNKVCHNTVITFFLIVNSPKDYLLPNKTYQTVTYLLPNDL